jgi:phage tail sheath gpL-like
MGDPARPLATLYVRALAPRFPYALELQIEESGKAPPT